MSKHLRHLLAKLNEATKQKNAYTYLLIFSMLYLFVTAVYAGYSATVYQLNNGDQYVSAAIYGDISDGDPMVASGHTNILKAPILWVQGNLPQTQQLYIITNIALLLISIVVWGGLIGKILGKKLLPVLFIAFGTILVSSPTLAIDLSMVTIRHIEYPLALIFILGLRFLFNQRVNSKRVIAYALGLSFLLSIIVLNDKFFLYTLVPASLIASIIYGLYQKDRTKLIRVILVIISGTALSLIALKILPLIGFITISSGYAEAISVIRLDNLLDSITTTLTNILNLFGALIFGQEIRKANISLFLGFIIFSGVVAGYYFALKSKHKKETQFVHLFFLLFTLTIIAAYILPGFANSSSTRYLTGIVFIGITYFAYAVVRLSQYKAVLYPLVCIGLIATAALSIPRVTSVYHNNLVQVDRDNQRTLLTAKLLKENDTKIVVTSGGHYSLWFFANAQLTLVQLEKNCDTPSPWANNASWLVSKNEQKSAFLVDQTYGELAGRSCSKESVQKIYGPASKIKEIAKPGEKDTEATSYLLFYNHDIRKNFRNTP